MLFKGLHGKEANKFSQDLLEKLMPEGVGKEILEPDMTLYSELPTGPDGCTYSHAEVTENVVFALRKYYLTK